MPKLSDFLIWGKYFVLESNLGFNNVDGYSVKSKSRFRLPSFIPGQFASSLQDNYSFPLNFVKDNNSITKNDFPPGAFAASRVSNDLISSISNEINESLLVLELDFSGLTKHTDNGVSKKVFDLENKFEDFVAVIPDNIEDEIEHWLVLHDLLSEKISPIDSDIGLVVFTGEMFWSGWLGNLSILKMLEEYLKHDTKVILDFNGVWQLLINTASNNPEVFKFGHKEFSPDLYFLANPSIKDSKKYDKFILNNEEEEKQLIFDKNKAALFNLGEEAYFDQTGTELTGLVYINKYKFPEIGLHKRQIRSITNWMRGTRVLTANLATQRIAKEVSMLKVDDKIELQGKYELDIKKGQIVDEGERIGRRINKNNFLIDVSDVINIDEKLLCIHGQHVQKDQSLLEKSSLGGLKKTTLKAEVAGKLNLDSLDDGLIIIETGNSKVDVQLPFTGKYIRNIQLNTPMFQVEGIKLMIDTFWGKKVQGRLSGAKLKNSQEQKIIWLETASEFNEENLKTMLNQNVTGILFTHAKESDIEEIRSNSLFKRGLFSFGVISSSGGKNLFEIRSFLNKHNSSFSTLQKNSLFVVTKQSIFSKYLGLTTHDGEIVEPNRGMLVRIIGYYQNPAYARIEKVENEVALINDSERIYETNLINLLAI